MKLRDAVGVLCVVAGSAVAQDAARDAAFADALENLEIPQILGTRFVARALAARCDDVGLAVDVEQEVSALRMTRSLDWSLVSSRDVSVEARALSDAFDLKYGAEYDVDRVAVADLPVEICSSARSEAATGTLLGMMLVQ